MTKTWVPDSSRPQRGCQTSDFSRQTRRSIPRSSGLDSRHALGTALAATDGTAKLTLDGDGASTGDSRGDRGRGRQRRDGDGRAGRAGGRNERAEELGAERAARLNAEQWAGVRLEGRRGGVVLAVSHCSCSPRRCGDDGSRAPEGAMVDMSQ